MTEGTPGEVVWPGLDGQRLTKQLSGSGGDAGPALSRFGKEIQITWIKEIQIAWVKEMQESRTRADAAVHNLDLDKF